MILLKSIFINLLDLDRGTSLAVQWLGLCTSTVGSTGSIPGWGTKILRTTWYSASSPPLTELDREPDTLSTEGQCEKIKIVLKNSVIPSHVKSRETKVQENKDKPKTVTQCQ